MKALPFSIENVALSDLFQNNLKVAKVYVGINGGTAAEWSATSIAIAEKVSTFGADSIEVSVNRDDVKQTRGVRFRELAHAYYSPNPAHTVWEGDPQWKVLQADPAHLSTQQEVSITEEYDTLNQALIDKGMNNEAADRKAAAAIAKKYHLPKDWMLPVGNTLSDVSRESMNVDAGPASAALASLDKCMNGKIIRMLTTCDNR
ncbi:hypothetical protein [Paraburkholderia guartelaensis]|uniref:Uncharacterized protein n=1 Tax=Paraburkholderia guartelaensis TaxID=2546446 RepID=A0ABU9S423_9BURK